MNSQSTAFNRPSLELKTWSHPHVCYWGLWLFIMYVSVWDCFLTLMYRSQLQITELNPMGRALIELNGGGVTYLLVAKVIGTILVTSILAALYEHDPRRAFAIAGPIAGFQFALLLFLSFA